MSERLALVTRFEELGAGMKVVVTPCGWCGERHELFLLRLIAEDMVGPYGLPELSFGWVPAENPPCASPGDPPVSLTWESVAMRKVFRVVDGLEAETEARTKSKAKPKETVGR
jgi:hypothetical protein